MRTALIVLLTIVGLGLVAALVLYWKLRRYLARSGQGVKTTMSEIGEEIDSYHEKTQ